jgi:hypothetical protein
LIAQRLFHILSRTLFPSYSQQSFIDIHSIKQGECKMQKLKIAMGLAVVAALILTTGVFAIFFTNGNFESGDWTPGWDGAGQREFKLFTGGYDVTGFPVLANGGSDLSSIVGGPAVAALSLSDPKTGDVLKYPAVGHYSAKINNENSNTNGGFPQNANTLSQSVVIDAGDIDATDNLVHLRMLYAAVVSFPREDLGAVAHTFDELPMFFLEVRNETDNAIIFHKQSYAGEPGIPWQDGPMANSNSQWKFLDWSYVDVIVGDASMVGKTISIKIVGTGCSLGGHPGYVYVDELGSSHVGIPAVVATGPATRKTGQTITYTYNYFNGSSDSINPTIGVNPPAGVTFTSADPACTSNGSGGYNCAFSNVPGNGGGNFQIQGTVTALAGSTIYHGDYNISATGYPTLTGPVVVTDVLAANTPPVAVNDRYGTRMSVTINGASVLTNDTDAESDPLTATLVTGPAHASAFTLNADGTFTYEPENGFKGVDYFYYRANDGTDNSNLARVRILVRPRVMTLRSTNWQDGWIMEDAQDSEIGGIIMGPTDRSELRMGDANQNQQYRSIISFDTRRLSNNAVIINGYVRLNQEGFVGPVDPFTTHGNLIADMKTGYFGTSENLESVDFQSRSTSNNIGRFTLDSVGWQRLWLPETTIPLIDLVGDRTQFRIRFSIANNNDFIENYVHFYAGANDKQRRPTLTLWYYVPHP